MDATKFRIISANTKSTHSYPLEEREPCDTDRGKGSGTLETECDAFRAKGLLRSQPGLLKTRKGRALTAPFCSQHQAYISGGATLHPLRTSVPPLIPGQPYEAAQIIPKSTAGI